jgi:hypothetical protein
MLRLQPIALLDKLPKTLAICICNALFDFCISASYLGNRIGCFKEDPLEQFT